MKFEAYRFGIMKAGDHRATVTPYTSGDFKPVVSTVLLRS